MSEKILIRVGSTSEHKLGAVRDACEALGIDAEIVGIAAKSGVNEQPFGIEEMTDGAIARAHKAAGPAFPLSERGAIMLMADPIHPDVGIGIENGVVKMGRDVTVDMAVVVAKKGTIKPVDGADATSARQYIAVSSGHEVSSLDAGLAMLRGFDKHTVASVTAERTGCDPKDATPYYTGGRVTRRELLAQAVKVVLAQWLTDKEREEKKA